MELVRDDIRPSQILTRDASRTRSPPSPATGGSTNGVLHLLAIAREVGIELELDDFDSIADRDPDRRRPEAGRPLRRDRHVRGRRRRARRARARRRARCVTATRAASTAARSARSATRPSRRPGQDVVVSVADAAEADAAGSRSCAARSRPTARVVKLAGHERLHHRGPARVFDSEEACFAAVKARAIKPGDVVVIRYEGPAGGPGMREMLHVTGGARRRGPRRRGRADHRRPVLGRDARPDGRPRRRRRRSAAARSPRVRDGDTDHASTSSRAR